MFSTCYLLTYVANVYILALLTFKCTAKNAYLVSLSTRFLRLLVSSCQQVKNKLLTTCNSLEGFSDLY